MFTRKSAKSFFCCFVFSALFLGALAAAGRPVTPQEKPPPSKTFEIEGGSIRVLGGILVSPGPKVILTRKREHLKLEYLVSVRNRSSREVWVVVEFHLPGTNKTHRKRKKIKSKKGKGFTWKVKKEAINWDAEYSFTVSVFADKKKKKPLGAESYSFLFDDGRREELETAQNAVMELFRNGQIGNALVSGWPDEQVAKLEPPFEWKEGYSSTGASLIITEKRRMPLRGSTVVVYEIRSTGFSAEENFTLWRKIGEDFEELPVTLTQEGTVQIIAGVDIVMIGGYMRGEPFDLAMFARDSGKRAHAKVYPFPIQAQGEGGCSVTLELLSKSGYLFGVIFEGFQPGEKITSTSRYKKEKLTDVLEASGDGALSIPILFGPPDRGTATVSATGGNCTVSLEYKVGKDARKLP